MNGFLFHGYSFLTIITVLLSAAVLIGINEITRRSKKLSFAIYLYLPIVLIVLIALGVVSSPSTKNWFGVVKTLSAAAGVVGFLFIRFYKKVENSKFTIIFPSFILIFNCLEAIYRDFEFYFNYGGTSFFDPASNLLLTGGAWNILNGIAGILMIAAITGHAGIKISNDRFRDMVWPDQHIWWVIGYTIWNFAYCYNCISTRSMYAGFLLMISCGICELFIKKGAWLQHRAQTLAFFGMFSLAFDYQSMGAFGITASYNPKAWMFVSLLSFVFNLGLFSFTVYKIIKVKKNPFKYDIFTDLKEYKEIVKINNL